MHEKDNHVIRAIALRKEYNINLHEPDSIYLLRFMYVRTETMNIIFYPISLNHA